MVSARRDNGFVVPVLGCVAGEGCGSSSGTVGKAIIQYWLHETLTTWLLPLSVWEPLEDHLERVHQQFYGAIRPRPDGLPINKAEVQASLDKVRALMWGADDIGDNEIAPWKDYVVDAKSTKIHSGQPICRMYITGADPC